MPMEVGSVYRVDGGQPVSYNARIVGAIAAPVEPRARRMDALRKILFVLRELCASVVKHFFQWTLFDARMAVDES
jgi:hypothetical protein